MKTRQVQMKVLAKVLRIISNVVFWITAAGFVLFLLASIFISLIPRENLVISSNI